MKSLPLRLNLAFASASFERRFSRHYQVFYYRYAQANLALGTIIILADFFADRLAFGAEPANTLRVELCLPIAAICLTGSFTPFAKRHWQFVMSAAIVAVGCSLFWVLLLIDRQGGMGLMTWDGVRNFVTLEFFCFVILGVQFRYAFGSGLAILVMFEFAMHIAFGTNWRMLCYWSYHTVTLFILAGMIGWWREFAIRKDFSMRTSLKAARNSLRHQNDMLESEVERRTSKIRQTQDAAILLLGSLVETRDHETGNHIRRTQHYVKALAKRLQTHPGYAAQLANDQIEILYKSAPLHDIGKVGIPDSTLQKPGHLDPEEYRVMQTHTSLGYEVIEMTERRLGGEVEFLACAKEIALNHHEKWDGSGYPRQLAGQNIPISARLMAVADVYDALTASRVYKAPMPHDEAVAIIQKSSGTHFDPEIVAAFTAIEAEFQGIARRFSD